MKLLFLIPLLAACGAGAARGQDNQSPAPAGTLLVGNKGEDSLSFIDLATGAGMILTSVFVHFGCLAIGFLAVRRLGWPRHTWLVATGASLVPLVLARIFTPPGPNVMLAFRIHDGWEKHFSSHAQYLAVMIGGSAVVFFVVEMLARRALGVSSAPR